MPSGCTSKIFEGKPQTFRQFALRCARLFGPCIEQRDESLDIKPRLQSVPDYNLERLAEAKEELARLRRMSLAEAEAEINKDFESIVAERRESDQRKQELRRRYVGMKIAVEAWQPPTPDHVNLKAFMLEQLDMSIRNDCCAGYPKIPDKVSPEQWLARRIEAEMKDIDYYTKEHLKAVEETERANSWIRALYRSLEEE